METKSRLARFGAVLLTAIWISSPASASAGTYGSARTAQAVYSNLTLLNGDTANVYANGLAQIVSKDGRTIEMTTIQPSVHYDGGTNAAQPQLPDEGRIIAQLSQGPQQPFVPDRVIVVYRDSVATLQDVVTVNTETLKTMHDAVARKALSMVGLPTYTTDIAVNFALGTLGVDSHERLFRQFSRSTLSTLHSRGASTMGRAPLLNVANAYSVHLTNGSVRQAVQTLAKLPGVAYVSPDWTISPMHTQPVPLPSDVVAASQMQAQTMAMHPRAMSTRMSTTQALPTNFAITASAQSMLNAPGVDAVAAYDEVESRFQQLPGTGEIITNVSIGDLDDASQTSFTDPCGGYVRAFGPTTVLVNGQRYINFPSMPLIPTYVTLPDGSLSGAAAICGADPFLGEIGMDFSVMAPLPHDQQRAGEVGTGVRDLLGIAPGANYRLIVPSSLTSSGMDAAFLAAATQTPRTNVITASLGFGLDQYGFSGRYEEEDPLTQSLIQTIVQNYNIVFCISAGDGTRTYTNVAIGPTGGSVATNLAPVGGTPTDFNDVALSTAPSAVFDSGAIDVGATTLNDIFSDEPQYATTPAKAAQQAYTETRWNGFLAFSSGFGSRVNVSAPGDNIVTMAHHRGGAADAVDVTLNGGTSASAPEAAAAAAVVLQVARLTNHPLNAVGARQVLEQTGTTVPNVDQADTNLNIGPQVDLRAAVESLLDTSPSTKPAVARVAVSQRVDLGGYDGAFFGPTDPTNINLSGGPRPGANWLAWITIAPDWEFVPTNARYSLFVKGNPMGVLATTSSARFLPATLFSAAKLNVHTTTAKSVTLTYQALAPQGNKVLASVDIPLTLGAPPMTEDAMLAPKVAPVTTGTTIPVQYDLSNVGDLSNPQLIVSAPGRFLPLGGQASQLNHTIYTVPLTQTKGTINVPASRLQGGGIYSIAIVNHSSVNGTYYSDFAFTRFAPEGAARPSAPVLSQNGSTPAHFLEIPYGSTFQVQYDVSNVPNATGAQLEISAAGPGIWGNYNPFNNPNGSMKDQNGIDSGSVYYAPVSGTKGTVTLNGTAIGLDPSLDHVVRVIPTSGTTVVGEGSDVSSLMMDGVNANDGGTAFQGWGVNQNGTDAVLTSFHRLASGANYGTFDIFDQTTNQITKRQSAQNNAYSVNGWAIWANDMGLVCDLVNQEICFTYSSVATAKIKGLWSAQNGGLNVVEAAPNSANDVAAMLTLGSAGWQLMTSDLVANTFTSYSLKTVPGFLGPQYNGIAENTTTNTGVLAMYDARNGSMPASIGLVNLASGAITTFTGAAPAPAKPQGLAVDSVSNKAAVAMSDGGLAIYNLASQTGNEVFFPQCTGCGNFGLWTAADPSHSLFLAAEPIGEDVLTNNNAMSQVAVYDESGNLVKELKTISLINMRLAVQTNWLQVNPNTREGYVVGPGGSQLIPFAY